ncbi:YfbU family protein [Vogesella indigofera]|uniref:YfbU family protein n=1 Tax=Vogesella indigofera TaxID=45465 RepID=UPI0035B36EB3
MSRLDALQGGHESDSYMKIATNLRDGHEWLYSQMFDYFADVLDEESAQHVLDILQLYDALKFSYEKLADKSGIDPSDIEFDGFDGNNESEMLGFADALFKDARFESLLKGRDLNSHYPTYDVYCRMLEKWDELGRPQFPLSKVAITAIIDARIHPENR